MNNILFRTIGGHERLVDRVVNELQRMITAREVLPGTRLPPQEELAVQIGVSRTVVREAVHILVTRGLLESRPGVGMTVREVDQQQITQPFSLLLKIHDPDLAIAKLYQVRVVLEVANAEIAAANVTAEEIAHLEQCLHHLEAAHSNADAYVDRDLEFHCAVASATHNILLSTLLDSISGLLREVLILVNRNDNIEAHAAWSIPYHRLILECIARRDPAAAGAAMAEHLKTGREYQEEVLARICQTSGASVPVLTLPSQRVGLGSV